MPWTWPRRDERSPIRSPTYSLGAVISTFITGSSSVGLAAAIASL